MPTLISDDSLIDIDIVKRTARTLRRVGIITVAWQDGLSAEEPPEQQLLRWTVGKRALLDDNQQTFDWLSKGWIVKEVRFKQDGKSVDRIYYRMGYLLYVQLINKQKDTERDIIDQFTFYQSEAARRMEEIMCVPGERMLQLKGLTVFLTDSLAWSIGTLKDQAVFLRIGVYQNESIHYTFYWLLAWFLVPKKYLTGKKLARSITRVLEALRHLICLK